MPSVSLPLAPASVSYTFRRPFSTAPTLGGREIRFDTAGGFWSATLEFAPSMDQAMNESLRAVLARAHSVTDVAIQVPLYTSRPAAVSESIIERQGDSLTRFAVTTGTVPTPGQIITVYAADAPEAFTARTVVGTEGNGITLDYPIAQDFLPGDPLRIIAGAPVFRGKLSRPESYSWLMTRPRYEDALQVDFVEDIAGIFLNTLCYLITDDGCTLRTGGTVPDTARVEVDR